MKPEKKANANPLQRSAPAQQATSALGSKSNPYTAETLPSDYVQNRTNYANAYFKTKGNGDNPSQVVQFDAEGGCGLRGNWRGTSHEREGGAARRFVAPRLKLSTGDFIALLPKKAEENAGGGLSAENYAARQRKAEMGLSLIQLLMEKVKIELPESPERTIERQRTADEIQSLLSECSGNVASFAAKLAANPTIKETLPASAGGKYSLYDLANNGAIVIPPGVMADIRRTVNESLTEAFSVLTA